MAKIEPLWPQSQFADFMSAPSNDRKPVKTNSPGRMIALAARSLSLGLTNGAKENGNQIKRN